MKNLKRPPPLQRIIIRKNFPFFSFSGRKQYFFPPFFILWRGGGLFSALENFFFFISEKKKKIFSYNCSQKGGEGVFCWDFISFYISVEGVDLFSYLEIILLLLVREEKESIFLLSFSETENNPPPPENNKKKKNTFFFFRWKEEEEEEYFLKIKRSPLQRIIRKKNIFFSFCYSLEGGGLFSVFENILLLHFREEKEYLFLLLFSGGGGTFMPRSPLFLSWE